jgi:O-antigen/teichoic acid export membrane protein
MTRPSRRLTSLRLGWGIADQAVSSVENFLLGVFVAHKMGAESLGVLAIVLFVYGLGLNGARAVGTDPLMVRFSGSAGAPRNKAVASAVGSALVVGMFAGLLCVLGGMVSLGPLGMHPLGVALLTLGAGFPALMVQDSWRYVFFSAGQGIKAFTNDLVWTALLVASLILELALGVSSVGWAVAAFVLTAAVAAAFGGWQAKVQPRVRFVPAWLRNHRDLGVRFLGENLTRGLGGQMRSLIVAATVGLAAAGAIRGAEMLIAPAVTVLMGAAQVAVPEAVSVLTRGVAALRRLCLLLSGALAVLALLWGLAVLVVFPFGPGHLVLGPVWSSARVLVPGVIVSATLGCLNVGPAAGLRALQRADRSMRAQLIISPIAIGLCAACGLIWGAQGAVWGSAAGAAIGVTIWWRNLASAAAKAAADAVTVEPPPEQRAVVEPPSIAQVSVQLDEKPVGFGTATHQVVE